MVLFSCRLKVRQRAGPQGKELAKLGTALSWFHQADKYGGDRVQNTCISWRYPQSRLQRLMALDDASHGTGAVPRRSVRISPVSIHSLTDQGMKSS